MKFFVISLLIVSLYQNFLVVQRKKKIPAISTSGKKTVEILAANRDTYYSDKKANLRRVIFNSSLNPEKPKHQTGLKKSKTYLADLEIRMK